MGSSYRVYDEAGKLAKKVHYDDDYWRVLAVADDGSDAVRLVFKRKCCCGVVIPNGDL